MGVRWPAGLHAASGSLPATGAAPLRMRATRQRDYWRQTETALHAGANGQFTLKYAVAGGAWVASAGPHAVGEKWYVDLVQVNSGIGYGSPPVVSQQILAQTTGGTAIQPPPVPAQAWLSIGGVNVYLLAQTTNGTNDALTVSCPVLTPGEAVTVVWFAPVAPPWMTLRGTRYALSVT